VRKLSGSSSPEELGAAFHAAMQKWPISTKLGWLRATTPMYLGGGWSVVPDREGNTFRYHHDPDHEFRDLVQPTSEDID
jgi:hypothetical protein